MSLRLRLSLRLRSREVDAKERGKVRGIGRRPGCEGKGGMVGMAYENMVWYTYVCIDG